MVVISDILVQGVQMLLVLLLAPLLTGFVRKIKARLVRRQGASVFQPYRDLLRLLRKEVVLADNASWLFSEVVPVDLHIAGCPPRPTAMLQGLLALLERADAAAVVP